MRRIGFGLGARVRVGPLLRLRFFVSFFVGQIRFFAGVNFFALFGRPFFALGRFLIFFVFLFKHCAPNHGVGRGVSLRLFVLGLDQARGDYCHLVIAKRSVRASRFRLRRFLRASGSFRDGRTGIFAHSRNFFGAGCRRFWFVSRFSQQPTRQAARRAPWHVATEPGSSRLRRRSPRL